MKIPLTCCIPTLNEEMNIEKCIKSVLWVDEIIVLDSCSEDKTVDIAKGLGANVYIRKWDNTANQFSYLFSLSKNDWVLHLDADEICSTQLQEEIKQLLENSHKMIEYDAYLVNRKTFFLNKWIKRCGWYPDYGIRIFKKDKIVITNKGFHHRISVNGSIHALTENAAILHYTANTIDRYITKIKREAFIMAKWRFENGERFSASKVILKSSFNFFKSYILKLGFLDGSKGFIISILSSVYVILQYVKLWEYEKST